jgi:vacuolar-type H+-ATPase subunit H
VLKQTREEIDMAKQPAKTNLKSDEFTKIFDDYRARIDEITKKTSDESEGVPKAKAQDIVESEITKSKESIDKESAGPDIFVDEIEWQANKRAAEIVKEAKLQAQRMIYEAEDKIRKEAKKKTQAHIDKIIEKSKKESEDIIERAREIAEREKTETISSSKQQLETLVQEITEKAREETEAQSSQILGQARQNAEKMISDVVNSSKEISEKVMQIMNHTKTTVNKFQEELQSGLRELAEAVEETQNTLETIMAGIADKSEAVTGTIQEPTNTDMELMENTVLSVKFMGDKNNNKNGNDPLFSGKVELKSVTSFEYRHLKNLMNYLVHIPGIKYVQENASEKEMSVVFDIKEPMPLIDILKDIPLVEKVIQEGNGANLVLKKET